MSIEVRINKLLKDRKRSAYWLAKETGISYTTIWRLGKGDALGINFATLEKICRALNCNPGELLAIAVRKKKSGDVRDKASL
ncbi:MAG: helix-turn-helix transcriptional regulator [Acidobacteriota bacterium]|nr:MAG: helix-turn-helix transcriptional regulator [Acidobacteriota bacterium]